MTNLLSGALTTDLTARFATMWCFTRKSFIVLCMGLVLLAAIAITRLVFSADSYEQALHNGQQAIPYARECSQLFPDVTSFYSYYTGEYGPPTWNSEVRLYGRYILTMQIKVTFDQSRTRVVDFDKPTFHLVEVTEISVSQNGNVETRYGDLQLEFGEKEWRNIGRDNGSLSSLGVDLIKDRPIPGFAPSRK